MSMIFETLENRIYRIQKPLDAYAVSQIPIMAKDPCYFPEGSFVRSKFSGNVYIITKHFKNGMCNMYRPDIRSNEHWNACNNQHFIPADYVSLSVRSLCLQ